MSYGKAIVGILDADVTYSALIGTDDSIVKVYPSEAPNISKPYAVFHLVSRTEDHNKDERGLITYNIQLDHYDDDHDDLIALDNAAISALDHYKGTINGVKVNSIRVFSGDSGFTSETESDRISSEFSVKIQP